MARTVAWAVCPAATLGGNGEVVATMTPWARTPPATSSSERAATAKGTAREWLGNFGLDMLPPSLEIWRANRPGGRDGARTFSGEDGRPSSWRGRAGAAASRRRRRVDGARGARPL